MMSDQTEKKQVTTLLECASGFNGSTSTCKLDDKEVQNELKRLPTDSSYSDGLLQLLFPNGYPRDSQALDALFKFAYHVTEFATAEKVATCLLSRLFSNAGTNAIETILLSITESSNNKFWQNIRLLPACLSDHILPPDFLADWFVSCSSREGNNLAGGQAFELAKEYTVRNPEIALLIVQHYMQSTLTGDRMILAQVILGSIRISTCRTDPLNNQLQDLDRDLSESTRIDYRVCYHRSWGTTFKRQPFDSEHIEQRLSVMLAGSEEEITSAFFVLTRIAYHFSDKKDALISATDWLTANTNKSISAESKHCVVWLLHQLLVCDQKGPACSIVSKLMKIAALLYPVPLENKGTWELLLNFSVRCIPHCTPSEFVKYWIDLVQQSPDKLFVEDIAHDSESMFWYHLKESFNEEVITLLIFSENHLARRYGRRFFEKMEISIFTPAVIDKCSEGLLLITLLEYVRRLREGPLLLKFFLAIAPRMMTCGDKLIARFKHEVFRQIVNLPDSLLPPLKSASATLLVFVDPVNSAEKYFDKLKTTHDLPINFFHCNEIDSAVRLFNRKFASTIRKGVEENSFFMAITGKPVSILYGTSFANAYGGNLSDASSFKQFSHSSEWPRLQCIDPDGEMLVELHYASEIERLLNDECKSE